MSRKICKIGILDLTSKENYTQIDLTNVRSVHVNKTFFMLRQYVTLTYNSGKQSQVSLSSMIVNGVKYPTLQEALNAFMDLVHGVSASSCHKSTDTLTEYLHYNIPTTEKDALSTSEIVELFAKAPGNIRLKPSYARKLLPNLVRDGTLMVVGNRPKRYYLNNTP